MRQVQNLVFAFLIFSLSPAYFVETVSADPGKFWYGLFGTATGSTWGDGVYDSMKTRYKMNWAFDRTRNEGNLDLIADAGLKSVTFPYGISDELNAVFRFSTANYIRWEADGDTVAYLRNPDAAGGGSYVTASGGQQVTDAAADNGKAWFFNKGTHTAGSAVWMRANVLRAREHVFGGTHSVVFRFRIRGTQPASSSTVVAKFFQRGWGGSPVYRQLEITGSDIAETYLEKTLQFNLPSKPDDAPENWFTEIGVEWAGQDSLWVDWIADTDADGYDLAIGLRDGSVEDFVWDWSFGDDTTVIAFWMDEEQYSDANVYPHKRVDSLIKERIPRMFGFTQNHILEWWPTRNQFGGRTAAGARVTDAKYVSWLSYPFSGYNPQSMQVSSTGLRADTTFLCTASPPQTCAQATSDTTICFQSVMDEQASFLRMHREFCDSIGARFVPFMHAFSHFERPKPDSCNIDTNWTQVFREPTANEVKCHAGVALANGVQGFPYFKYESTYYTMTHGLQCLPSPYTYLILKGLADLPGAQAGLASFVGPFVDSLGRFFADFIWLGGGRVDPTIATGALLDMFDSVKSVTFGEAFIEAGVYELNGVEHFLLVNRRAYDTLDQTIRVWLDHTGAPIQVTDLYSYETFLCDTIGSVVPSFDVTIPPGESRLFRLTPFEWTMTSGTERRAWLDLPGTYRVLEIDENDNYVDSSMTGSLMDGTTPFTTASGVGSSKRFRLIRTQVSGNSFPLRWEGGVRIAGNTTLESGRTLTIEPGSEVLVNGGGGYTFNVYGNMVAVGTASDTIKFRHNSGTPYTTAWNGIKQFGPGDLTLDYVQLQHAYKGLWIVDPTQTSSTTVNHCDFRSNYIAGIYVESDSVSAASITNSHFKNMGWYGVYIYKGKVDIQDCRFTDSLYNAIRIEGASFRVGGGLIERIEIDSLSRNGASGIYLQNVYRDTRRYSLGDVLLRDIKFGPTWTATSGVAAIYVNNCVDSLRFQRISVAGTSATGSGSEPDYGILNFSTTTHLLGDLLRPEEESSIQWANWGLACYSASASDSNYAKVRKSSFYYNNRNVFIDNNSMADLGHDTGSTWGENVFHGLLSCGSCSPPPTSYNVYYGSTTRWVPAERNYWKGNHACLCWPFNLSGYKIDHAPYISQNPFADSLAKRVVPMELEADTTGVFGTRPLVVRGFPNPFNSSHNLQVELAMASEVSIDIFNVLGQHVKTVWNGARSAGQHTFAWEGRDDRGRELSSGVYFCRIQAGDKTITRKVVMIK